MGAEKSTVRSRYQSTTSGTTECYMCAVVTVILSVCKPVIVFKSFVGTSYKCSVYPITNPDPMSSQ
jgi:hypothetical protein